LRNRYNDKYYGFEIRVVYASSHWWYISAMETAFITLMKKKITDVITID
jgi:hypothetical protein